MATIVLGDCFPAGPDGSRRPLPKQKLFMDTVLDLKGAPYVLYSGGVGSGKTLIGCITMICLAVQYPGDYLICRLFNPELKLTTYKTFLEVCPPELIVEHRVADQIVKIRSAGGKISNVIFRGLEDPEKHRSLNLNAAYIDESSQVSEEAFTLLQGRLRGAHVRKIFMTTNPNGHTWQHRYFIKKDWANEAAKRKFVHISAPSTENIHLPEGYVDGMLATWSEERIRREVMGSWDAFAGQVYTEFSRNVHVIKPFRIPEEWTKFIAGDHGYRNPAAFLWISVDYDGNLYVYREFYEREWHIDEIVTGNKRPGYEGKGIVALSGKEKIEGVWIDPSTKADRGKEADFTTYAENLPKDWSLIPANNQVGTGIDRVKQYLRIDEKTHKPRIFIFDTCLNLIEEMSQYRYEELSPGKEGQKNTKESPVKKDDHACFVAGTLVRTLLGQRPIEQIRVGELVLTRAGFRKVTAAGSVGERVVGTYVFANGQEITATPDHPVFTLSGKKAISLLTPIDTCVNIGVWQKLFLTESFLGRLGLTIAQMAHTAVVASKRCTERCGRLITAQSPLDAISTIGTEIPTITRLPTSSVWMGLSISRSTLPVQVHGATRQSAARTWSQFARWQRGGTGRRMAWNGTGSTESASPRKISMLGRFINSARSAGSLFWRTLWQPFGVNSVIRIVDSRISGTAAVFNLTVEQDHEYFVGDLLVSNCDALRYGVMSRPEAPIVADKRKKFREGSSPEASIARELHEIKHPVQRDVFNDYDYGEDL